MTLEPSAAYEPKSGYRSLVKKLVENGRSSVTTLQPEWAEVREVMRETDRLASALLKHLTNAKIAEGYHYKDAQTFAQAEVAKVRDGD